MIPRERLVEVPRAFDFAPTVDPGKTRLILAQKIQNAILIGTQSVTDAGVVELFGVSGPGRYMVLVDLSGLAVGRVDIDEIQKLAFLEMAEYGVHPEAGASEREPMIHDFHGTAMEELIFPSPTHTNLEFYRWRQYYTDTDKTFAFGWSVRQHPLQSAPQTPGSA